MKFPALLLGLLLCLSVFGCGTNQNNDLASISQVVPGEIPNSIPFAEPPVTQEMADAVKLSQEYVEVMRMLGSPGTEVPRETKNVAGVKRYVWRNRDGSALILDFKSSKLVVKEWRKPKK